MSKSRALIDHMPMAIDKGLATVFGLDLAALLQEIHFSVTAKELNPHKYKDSLKDGYFWYYDTKVNIQTNMPFLGSARTIQRLIAKGQEHGVLVVGEYNKMPGDNTNWFRINHVVLHQKMEEHYSKQNPNRYVNPDLKHTPPRQNVSTPKTKCLGPQDKMSLPPRQNVSTPKTKCLGPQDKMSLPPRQIGSTNTIDFTETSSETSSESKSPRKREQPSPEADSLFDEFWSPYPKKIKKKKCRQIFLKLTPEQQEMAANDLKKGRAHLDKRWLNKNGEPEFAPHPETYLNNEQWEDEWVPQQNPFSDSNPFAPVDADPGPVTINVAAESVETGETSTAMSLFAPPSDRPKRSMRDIFGNLPGIDFDAFEEAGQ